MKDLVKDYKNVLLVDVNSSYKILNLSFKTVPSYNINKDFHPKDQGYVGYILNIKGETIYISGDTDALSENKNIKCDIALIPIGGTFTMDYREAAEFVNIIKPKLVIPTHYGSIVGSKQDGITFNIKQTCFQLNILSLLYELKLVLFLFVLWLCLLLRR